MAAPVKPISSAVPRSGCLAISTMGIAVMAAGASSFHDQRASLADRAW